MASTLASMRNGPRAQRSPFVWIGCAVLAALLVWALDSHSADDLSTGPGPAEEQAGRNSDDRAAAARRAPAETIRSEAIVDPKASSVETAGSARPSETAEPAAAAEVLEMPEPIRAQLVRTYANEMRSLSGQVRATTPATAEESLADAEVRYGLALAEAAHTDLLGRLGNAIYVPEDSEIGDSNHGVEIFVSSGHKVVFKPDRGEIPALDQAILAMRRARLAVAQKQRDEFNLRPWTVREAAIATQKIPEYCEVDPLNSLRVRVRDELTEPDRW